MLAARANVDQLPYLFLYLQPRIVGILFARYSNTNAVVKLENAVKLLLTMALSHVLFTGKKHVVCKNQTSSCFEYVLSRTADATLVAVVRFDVGDLGVDWFVFKRSYLQLMGRSNKPIALL